MFWGLRLPHKNHIKRDFFIEILVDGHKLRAAFIFAGTIHNNNSQESQICEGGRLQGFKICGRQSIYLNIKSDFKPLNVEVRIPSKENCQALPHTYYYIGCNLHATALLPWWWCRYTPRNLNAKNPWKKGVKVIFLQEWF